MPRQGQSVESCIITSWSKKVGDEVKEGDILFSYETDKSSFDEVAAVSGTMLAILHGEGDEVPCLENVCVIGSAGEDISAFASAAPAPEEKKEEVKEEAEAKAKPVIETTVNTSEDGRVFASPRAKALAKKAGVDYAQAIPTGPDGRIIERDIQTLLDKGFVKAENAPAAAPAERTVAAPAPAAEEEYTEEKLSNVRKAIARNMMNSLQNSAQLTMSSSFDATAVQNYRAGVKANGEAMGLANITLNDIVLYAVAKTLMDFKAFNATLVDEKIRTYNNVQLGVAVDTERGLLVPVIRDANKLSLNELSKTAKQLANEAKEGHLSPDKMSGGSFTVTNIGSFGVESFTPIINAPQVAILGVCGITTRVKAGHDGQIATYPAMGLSLTIDHRAVDGAPAAKFLKALCTNLEHFDQLLAK